MMSRARSHQVRDLHRHARAETRVGHSPPGKETLPEEAEETRWRRCRRCRAAAKARAWRGGHASSERVAYAGEHAAMLQAAESLAERGGRALPV